jgi:hypothetical protein
MPGFCLRSHAGAKAANLDVLVFPLGMPSNQATNRSRLMVAAEAMSCKYVLTSPGNVFFATRML